jgi:tRNA threonylcarbamoyladenosine biosynthesis protein TsaE
MEKQFIVTQPADFMSVVAYVLEYFSAVPTPWFVALAGDLGAGKTTLVQEFARKLGVVEPVTSPTFILARQYVVEHPQIESLVHIDLYRIESEVELQPLRFSELLREKVLLCVEWPEMAPGFVPEDAVWVEIGVTENDERIVTVRTK